MGYFLAQQGRRFLIVDSARSIGAAWPTRWDSLTLFTPRRYDALPGLDFPGDADGYPMRDEVIAYLESYAESFELPIALGNGVRSVSARGELFVLELDDGSSIEADQVVVATGPFQGPARPCVCGRPCSGDLSGPQHRVPQAERPSGGNGSRGRRRQHGLSDRGRASRDPRCAPRGRLAPAPASAAVPRARPLLVAREDSTAPQDRRVPARPAHARSRHADRLEPALGPAGGRPHETARRSGVSGRTVTFADESVLDVDAVIWATGYRFDHSWIELPVADADGTLRHRRGVTDVRGLYFLGLPWQHTRGSALAGVGQGRRRVHRRRDRSTPRSDQIRRVPEGEAVHGN